MLKHPVALRLLLGPRGGPGDDHVAMLRGHVGRSTKEREALLEVREGLRGSRRAGQAFRHPSLVADWGLDYFDNESRIVTRPHRRLHEEELREEADG